MKSENLDFIEATTKIPKRLEIGGLTYQIIATDRLELGTGFAGEIDYTNLEIRLKKFNQYKMQQTLVHEMVHAIMASIGEQEHDERFVEGFSQGLYAAIRHNPEVFKSLSGEWDEKHEI